MIFQKIIEIISSLWTGLINLITILLKFCNKNQGTLTFIGLIIALYFSWAALDQTNQIFILESKPIIYISNWDLPIQIDQDTFLIHCNIINKGKIEANQLEIHARAYTKQNELFNEDAIPEKQSTIYPEQTISYAIKLNSNEMSQDQTLTKPPIANKDIQIDFIIKYKNPITHKEEIEEFNYTLYAGHSIPTIRQIIIK